MGIIKKPKNKLKWPIIFTSAIFFIGVSSVVLFYFFYEAEHEEKIYPGVFIGGIELSGLSKEKAREKINKRIDFFRNKGFLFSFQEKNAVLFPLVSSLESDSAYEIITFNTEAMVEKAYRAGRGRGIYNNIKNKIDMYHNRKVFSADYVINKEEIKLFLEENFQSFSSPAQDAKLEYSVSGYYRPIEFKVNKEQYGQVVNYEKGLLELEKNLRQLKNEQVALESEISYPEILKKDCLNINAKAKTLLEATPLELRYKDEKWLINGAQAAEWLTLKANPEKNSKKEDKVIVGLNFYKVEKYLLEGISPEINIEPQNAKFEVQNGKVKEFQVAKDGLALDIIKTYKKIENAFNEKEPEVALVVRELKSELNAKDINDYGIKEVIGAGHSNFAGSPSNRRHNIAVGAASVNGILIEPDEEFSLISALGEIDKESGYLPELVIKDGKTIPEYGGGLCQIGTTMFRATLAAGMPVTMRRNHSYRVSYYEPAGTDATIYNPWPDYKFLNDSPYHILIQSRIEGDDLYFDFWSTEDGRTASSTYPVIYNIVKPGPAKIIETTELAPGEKKCTEHAHNGADAFFDYTVTYPKNNPPQSIKEKDKEDISDEDYIIENRFSSHYVPWREVCLLGVEEISTSTEAISN